MKILCCAVLLAALPLPSQQTAKVVPGRFLVTYRNGQVPTDANAQVVQSGLHARVVESHQSLGIAIVDTTEPRGTITTAQDAETRARLAAQPNVEMVVQDRIVTGHFMPLRNIPNLEPFPTRAPSTGAANTTAAAPIEADIFYTLNPQDWAVKQVGGYGKSVPGGPATGPWDVTTGTGVRIAILDSGLDAQHPDIAPNLALNLSEVDQTALPSACDDGTPRDQQGHGTFTASLAAAAMGPGTGLMIGVAPTATLLNIKVLERLPGAGSTLPAQCNAGQASGLLSWVLKGINDAVANHADIISLSLGSVIDLSTGDGAGLKATFDSATHAAANAGVILIAAAGNDGLDLSNPRYIEIPAQSRDVLAIVATTNSACAQNIASGATCTPGPVSLAYYSNYGSPLNALAAPGGSYPAGDDYSVSGWVRGACSAGVPNTETGLPDALHSFGCFNLGHTQYVQAIGTSASAPLAAGVAALYRAANPSWSAAQVISAMRSSAVPTTNVPFPMVTAAPIHP
jgi:subtilisin family serine protease